jgi:hypothetical protein
MSSAIATRAGSASLAPQSFGEAVQFAQMLAKSGMVPKDYTNRPEAVMVALQWGAEVGLGPLQALNGISIINGKPSLWGDAALALVRSHPACAGIREGIEGEGDNRAGFCEVTRRGEAPQRRTFSVADAKKAGLWGKSGPWQNYPDRMLQMRARGFAIRDVFPDALRGVITVEEAQDIPAEPMPPARGPVIDAGAEIMAERAPPVVDGPDGWPMLAPDGSLKSAKHAAQWVTWCRVAIGKLESVQALDEWIAAMGLHFEALTAWDSDAVQAVRQAAGERRAAMMMESNDE